MENRPTLPIVWQKALKALHLICVILTGGSVALLGTLAWVGPPESDAARAWIRAAQFFNNAVLLYSYAGVVVTALIYALFTHWGFFQFRWLIFKWIAATVVFCLAWFYLVPGTDAMIAVADSGRQYSPNFEATRTSAWISGAAIFVILAIVVFVSTIKPWGPIRRAMRPVAFRVQLGLVAFAMLCATLGIGLPYAAQRQVRALPPPELDARGIPDGTYQGRYQFGFEYRVELDIRQERIAGARALAAPDNDYATRARAVLDRLAGENFRADAVTGATTSSKCYQQAAADALRAARTAANQRAP